MENNKYEDFINDFNELLSLEDTRYFYHVTPNDPDEICDKGLFLVENRLSSTTIEIPDEFRTDPVNYALNERGEGYRKNASIIILGIKDDEVEYAIQRNYDKPDSWNEFEFPDYVIPPNYIAGYIDTNNIEIVINEKYDLLNEHNL